LPTWYPTDAHPVEGIFIKEHAKAVSLYHNVTILYNEGADRGIKGLYTIKSDIFEDDIRTIRVGHKYLPVSKLRYGAYLWSLFNEFRRLKRKGWIPDIIHAHVYPTGIPAVILGKIYSTPVIITEHWTAFVLKALHRLNKFQVRFAMNRAELILPVSNELEDAIRWYGVRNKFDIVPNAINTDLFSPVLKVDNSDIKKILLVALISPQKGIPYLLGALAEIYKKRSDFILDIVGDGPNREEYRELSEKLGIGAIVNFHGIKTKREVAEFMQKCDFFVQPSLYETFGITFIEAMACGKPIIATDLPVLRDKIDADKGILVAPGDIMSLGSAIEFMFDHHSDFSPQVISDYVKKNFSYSAIGMKLDKIYNECINEYKNADCS